MTHTSWINERGVAGRDNERLEYLGDAVLELVAGEYLFRRFPGYDEGQLTQIRSSLVSTVALARLGEELLLGETLRLGKGAAKSGARRLTSLHANAFEALVGATFLDQGYRRAGRIFLSRIGDLSAWTDPNFKGRLQAVAQEKLGGPPQYRTAPVGADARSRQYFSQVSVEGHGALGEGRGGTKQAAEQAAARAALEKLMAPAPKRRRGRRALEPAESAPQPALQISSAPAPAAPAAPAAVEAPVAPLAAPGPSEGEEIGSVRRRRRRSRSRPSVDLSPGDSAAQSPPPAEPAPPIALAPALAGGADEAPVDAAVPARRRRRRSRTRPPTDLPLPEVPSELAPPSEPAALTVGAPVPQGGGEEAGPARRRRRRSRSRPADGGAGPRPAAEPERSAERSAEPAGGIEVPSVSPAPKRRPRGASRQVPGIAAAGPGVPQGEAAPTRRRRRPATAGDGEAAVPLTESNREVPAGVPEPGSLPRRTRRGHRGGRRRTKVVVSTPE